MKKIRSIIFLLLLFNKKAFSQGCSDAGVCSISSIHKSDTEKATSRSLEVGYIYGKGLEDIKYNSGFIGYSRDLKNNWGINSRITYNQASGNFGKLGRLGDIFFVINYKKELSKNAYFKPSFGIKAPLSFSNFKINDIPLPLDYQSSLGTLDALFGADYSYKKWNFDIAFQLPVWQINRNSFFNEYSGSDAFPTTNLFKRKPDALVRSAFNINNPNKNLLIKPSVMAIYHLGNDSYEDIFGSRREIKNSHGLTINASILTSYFINDKKSINLILATPLVVREIRPDGLTRSFVSSISYQLKF